MTKVQLQKLRKQLPYQYAKLISERTAMPLRAIRRVFSGETTNEKIVIKVVEVACEIRDERLNKRKSLITRISRPQKKRA